MKTKVCNVCLEEKKISKFEWQKNRPNPRKTCSKCREAQRPVEKRRQWKNKWAAEKRKEDPRYFARSCEKSLYGFCKEDFEYTICWICKSSENLHIDHCHSSGITRGLLCSHCNLALGNFKDSTESLKRAIMYLKDFPHFELK